MMKRLITWMYGFLMLLTLTLTCVLFCTTSTPGLYITLKGIQYFLPGTLKIKGLKGRLADHFEARKIVYEDNDLKVILNNVALNWKLSTLLKLDLKAQKVEASKLIVFKKRETPPPSIPHLPFKIHLAHLHLHELKVMHQGAIHRIHRIKAHRLMLNQKRYALEDINLTWEHTQFQAHAKGETRAPYHQNLSFFLSPTEKHEGLQGVIKLQGNQTGYDFLLQFEKPGKIKLKGLYSPEAGLQATAKWSHLHLYKTSSWSIHSPTGKANLEGPLKNLTINIENSLAQPFLGQMKTKITLKDGLLNLIHTLKTENGTLKAQFSHLKDHPWQGQIDAKDLDFSHHTPIHHVNFNANFKGQTLKNLKAKATFKAFYHQELVHGTFRFINTNTLLELSSLHTFLKLDGVFPYAWKLRAKISPLSDVFPRLKNLKTTLRLDGQIHNPQKGALNIFLDQGLLLDAKKPAEQFRGGKIICTLDAKGLHNHGELSIDAHRKLSVHIDLPQFKLNHIDLKTQKIKGDLNVFINDIRFIENAFPILKDPAGDFNLKLTLLGTLLKPDFQGNITLQNAKTQLKKFGLHLQKIQADLKSDHNTWSFKGVIFSNNIPLHLKGKGQILPLNGEINLKGQSVPIIDLPQYQFLATPNAKLILTDADLTLSGDVLIPKAAIKPVTFSNVITLPQEVRFIDKTNPEDKALPFYLNLSLTAGDNVVLDTKGLSGKLYGKMKLNYTPQSTLVASGELGIKEGKYRAFGQNLILQHGELIYAGGSIESPGIRLRAVRHFNHTTENFSGSNHLFDFNAENITPIDFSDKTTVGIEANGPMNNPKIKLFSIPSNLSQSDILSLLVLGRPASQASQAGGQLLLTAISSMNLESGTGGVQLLQQLKEDTGLDFNIQNNPTLDQQSKQVTDNTSFVLSKTISNRLILSYNIGLMGTDNNVLTLRYLLNQFFSLQVNTGVQGSGFDLLYSQSKDLPNE